MKRMVYLGCQRKIVGFVATNKVDKTVEITRGLEPQQPHVLVFSFFEVDINKTRRRHGGGKISFQMKMDKFLGTIQER